MLINLLRRCYNFLTWDPFLTKIWSQEAEDLFILELYQGKSPGVYLDVGAHQPKKFSNTYKLYKLGWNGVCIDPNPEFKKLWAQQRPRDKFYNIGISQRKDHLKYYKFSEPAYNGFFDASVKDHQFVKSTLEEIVEIQTMPLRDVLQMAEIFNTIDVLSIDVEGMDDEVLRTFPFEDYKPNIIVIEIGADAVKMTLQTNSNYIHPITKFLENQGYSMRSVLMNSVIFMKDC